MIPDRIRYALERKGMTQRQLADALDTTEVSISRYVTGNRTPKATTLKRIADICGVPVDFFFEDSKSKRTKAVIIKGMTIPEKCQYCHFLAWYRENGNIWCNVNNRLMERGHYGDIDIDRPDWCPMEETEVEG